jgi:hypothetical protein
MRGVFVDTEMVIRMGLVGMVRVVVVRVVRVAWEGVYGWSRRR